MKIQRPSQQSFMCIHSRIFFRPLCLHSFTQMKLSISPLKILNRAKIEFWTLGPLKSKNLKVNKNQIEKKMQRKHISDLEPEALIPNDKIRKSTTRRVQFGLPCWSNISRQEHLIEVRITPQARLIMSSLNDSTCNLNYIEWQRNLAIG